MLTVTRMEVTDRRTVATSPMVLYALLKTDLLNMIDRRAIPLTRVLPKTCNITSKRHLFPTLSPADWKTLQEAIVRGDAFHANKGIGDRVLFDALADAEKRGDVAASTLAIETRQRARLISKGKTYLRPTPDRLDELARVVENYNAEYKKHLSAFTDAELAARRRGPRKGPDRFDLQFNGSPAVKDMMKFWEQEEKEINTPIVTLTFTGVAAGKPFAGTVEFYPSPLTIDLDNWIEINVRPSVYYSIKSVYKFSELSGPWSVADIVSFFLPCIWALDELEKQGTKTPAPVPAAPDEVRETADGEPPFITQSREALRIQAGIISRRGDGPPLFNPGYSDEPAQLQTMPRKCGILWGKMVSDILSSGNIDGEAETNNLTQYGAHLGMTGEELKFAFVRVAGNLFPVRRFYTYQKKERVREDFYPLISIGFEYSKSDVDKYSKVGTRTAHYRQGVPVKRVFYRLPDWLKTRIRKPGGPGLIKTDTDFFFDLLGLSHYATLLFFLTCSSEERYHRKLSDLVKPDHLNLESELKKQGPQGVITILSGAFDELKSRGHLVRWRYNEKTKTFYWTRSPLYDLPANRALPATGESAPALPGLDAAPTESAPAIGGPTSDTFPDEISITDTDDKAR